MKINLHKSNQKERVSQCHHHHVAMLLECAKNMSREIVYKNKCYLELLAVFHTVVSLRSPLNIRKREHEHAKKLERSRNKKMKQQQHPQ